MVDADNWRMQDHTKGMISEKWKELPEDYCAKAKWEVAPTKPGDVVFFDSFVPHRSGMFS